jgi:hypothetical protein
MVALALVKRLGRAVAERAPSEGPFSGAGSFRVPGPGVTLKPVQDTEFLGHIFFLFVVIF